jgi:outer membrane protein
VDACPRGKAGFFVYRRITLLLASGGILLASPVAADTLTGALASAYWNNAQLNASRAEARAIDENVPLAKAQNRPTVTGSASVTALTRETVTGDLPPPARYNNENRLDGDFGVTVTQNLFNGFRARNGIRGAKSNVLSSHATLASTEQDILFSAAEVYMDVLRDLALLDLRRRNVIFLQEQLQAAQDRFEVGETTRTDVAQTRAALAQGQTEVAVAESNLAASRARYRQVVVDDPDNLAPGGFPFGRLVPRTLRSAIVMAMDGHPAIIAATYAADAAAYDVKQIEGEYLPSVTLEGNASRTFGILGDARNNWSNQASITTRLNIPIYQGGAVAARVRQAKEILGQREIEVDIQRDLVRVDVESAWARMEAAATAIVSATVQVEAATIALGGVQEEQRVGQRTTLDVLIQQQDLLTARETLVLAQRDRVVAAVALIRAIGRLTAQQLDLPTPRYDPREHYQEVEDKWFGLRTPDGR